MKTLHIFFMLILALAFSSCEDVIDIDVAAGKKTLVVEGWLTNKAEPQYVKLYYTQNIGNNAAFNMLTGAKLSLSDNAGNTEILHESEPGKYLITSLKSVNGRTYDLNIESTAGNYHATTEVRRISMPIDSVTFKFEKKSAIYEKEGYYPHVHGQEFEGLGDFIQVRLYKGGKYLNSDRDFNLFEDTFVDGHYIGNAELSVKNPFAKDDIVKAEVWSLTEDAYRFWLDIQIQLQNGQMFASPLANTRCNIKKTSTGATDVVGYFGASLVQSVETKVK